jgi:hypothetical protein
VRFINTLGGVPDADREAGVPWTCEPALRAAKRDATLSHEGTLRRGRLS